MYYTNQCQYITETQLKTEQALRNLQPYTTHGQPNPMISAASQLPLQSRPNLLDVPKAFTMAKNFTFFPLLPPELRTMIWLSSLEPRILEITSLPNRTPHSQFLFRAHLPAAFYICRESRATVDHLYVAQKLHPAQTSHIMRINTELDIFYFDTSPEPRFIPSKCFSYQVSFSVFRFYLYWAQERDITPDLLPK
jgi:hypothetical protein